MADSAMIEQAKHEIASMNTPNMILRLTPNVWIVPLGVDAVVCYRRIGTSFVMHALQRGDLLFPIGNRGPWTPTAEYVLEFYLPVEDQLFFFSPSGITNLRANEKGAVN